MYEKNTENVTCICVLDVNKQNGGLRDADKQRKKFTRLLGKLANNVICNILI